MKTAIKDSYVAIAVIITSMLGGSARAELTAIGFDTHAIVVLGGGSGVWGWQFSTREDIQVTALGLFDAGNLVNGEGGPFGDGLFEPHPIGIWDITSPSAPLVTSLIPTGQVASLVQSFRFVPVDPVILPANHDYAIGALSAGVDNTTGGGGNNAMLELAVAPGIEFGGRRWGGLSLSVLVFPENYVPGLEYEFGPNFTYTIVPEPSTFALLGMGSVLAFVTRQHRRRRHRCPA